LAAHIGTFGHTAAKRRDPIESGALALTVGFGAEGEEDGDPLVEVTGGEPQHPLLGDRGVWGLDEIGAPRPGIAIAPERGENRIVGQIVAEGQLDREAVLGGDQRGDGEVATDSGLVGPGERLGGVADVTVGPAEEEPVAVHAVVTALLRIALAELAVLEPRPG